MADNEDRAEIKQSDRNLRLDSDQTLGKKLGLVDDKDNQQETADPSMIDPNPDTVRAAREATSDDNTAVHKENSGRRE